MSPIGASGNDPGRIDFKPGANPSTTPCRLEEAGWRPTSQTPKWHGSRNSLSGCGMGIIQIKTREGFGFVARAGHERSGLTQKGGWLVEWSPHSQTSGRGGRAFDELQDIQELWPFQKSPTALGAHQIRPANTNATMQLFCSHYELDHSKTQ